MRVVSLARGRIAATAFVFASVALAVSGSYAADLPPVIVPTTPAPPPPVACGNTVYASAYYLYMTRRDPAPTPLVSFAGLPGSGNAIDAADFNFGWRDGVEARAGFLHCRIGVEVGGFTLRSWVATTTPFIDGTEDIVIETNPVTDVADVFTLTGENRTEIWGADANIVFQGSNFAIYGGAAYIHLTDELTISAFMRDPGSPTFPDGQGDYNWLVINSMIGPQIGARAMFGPMTPGSIFFGADIHGGILFNRVSNALTVTRPAPLLTLTGADTTTSIVPMLGASVKVGFQATANLSFSMGYRALWLGNVAMAPDQVSLTPNLNIPGPNVPIGTSATSHFLAHGLEVGVHLRF